MVVVKGSEFEWRRWCRLMLGKGTEGVRPLKEEENMGRLEGEQNRGGKQRDWISQERALIICTIWGYATVSPKGCWERKQLL